GAQERDRQQCDDRARQIEDREGLPRREEEIENAESRIEGEYDPRPRSQTAAITLGDPVAPALDFSRRGGHPRRISMNGLIPVSSSRRRMVASGAARRPIAISSGRVR